MENDNTEKKIILKKIKAKTLYIVITILFLVEFIFIVVYFASPASDKGKIIGVISIGLLLAIASILFFMMPFKQDKVIEDKQKIKKPDELSKLRFKLDDLLERKIYAENITDLILSSKNDINTICVNSSWGSGKTWFVNMWYNMINDEYNNQIIPVYYNAWENDDFENAFIPLLSEIDGQLAGNYGGENLDNLKKAAEAVIGYAVNAAIQLQTGGIVNLKTGIDKLFQKNKFEEYVDNYKTVKEAKKEFSLILEKFARDSIDEKKIVIFIDELDRCRPTFAVETLERIKHYFNVENIYFVLLLDKVQLSYSVNVLYGVECDTVGYLTRFIDIEFNLPIISLDKYIETKFNSTLKYTDEFLEVAKHFKLSLREYDKLPIVIDIFNSIMNNSFNMEIGDEFIYIITYLVLLKIKHPKSYNKFFDFRGVVHPEMVDIEIMLEVQLLIQAKLNKAGTVELFRKCYNIWESRGRRYYIDSQSENAKKEIEPYEEIDVFGKIHSITAIAVSGEIPPATDRGLRRKD